MRQLPQRLNLTDGGLAYFSSGKSAMTLGSTASLKQILEDVNGKFEVGTAYFPMVSESDKGGVSIGGASLWALNNEDEAKKAATWEFVKFLVSPESQAYWNAQTGYFPVTVRIWKNIPSSALPLTSFMIPLRSQQAPCSAYFLRQGRWLKRR